MARLLEVSESTEDERAVALYDGMLKHLKDVGNEIRTENAVLYKGGITGQFTNGEESWKVLERRFYPALAKYGIKPGVKYKIITEVLRNLPPPATSEWKALGKRDLLSALFEADNHLSVGKVEKLWAVASEYFAQNSTNFFFVDGFGAASGSIFDSVELMILARRSLSAENQKRVRELILKTGKNTPELKKFAPKLYRALAKVEKDAQACKLKVSIAELLEAKSRAQNKARK